jgi:hypothetical protein
MTPEQAAELEKITSEIKILADRARASGHFALADTLEQAMSEAWHALED